MDILKDYTTKQLRSILESRSPGADQQESFIDSIESSGVDSTRADSSRGAPENVLRNVPSETILETILYRQKAVYGEDDRMEVIDATNPTHRELASSVAAVFHVDDFIPISNSETSISSLTLEDRYRLQGKPLCSREPFREQPASAFGTAFLINSSMVATAYHCINPENVDRVRLVFDFAIDSGTMTAPTRFSVDDVYSVHRFVEGVFTEDAADWAVVELDRTVQGRQPLTCRREGRVEDGTPVFVVGHPLGLPKKIAGNAEIRINAHDDFFVANLDTYGGNSGSPVFNALTNEVEGILVRGEADFAPLGNCYASLVCPIGGCSGEECSRITKLSSDY